MASKHDQITEILTRGVEDVIVKEDLEKKLKSGKKLRIKLGIDPTAPDIHLGHTVALRKMKQFQDAGHQLVLIIGDFTATIGDPSGRSELRKSLSREEVKKYEANYLNEIGKIVDIKKAEIHHNSDWYDKLGALFVYELTSKVTIAKALERDDFAKRLKNNQDISVLEVLYPMLQGYDSVEVKADVEIGGTDQKFNLLMGRKIQRRYDMPEQNIITVPLIEGLDGVRKMSKSYGNYVGITDPADEMYGKVMSIPDKLIIKYFNLLTDVPSKEIKEFEDTMKKKRVNPKDVKAILAFELVRMYHGLREAEKAQDHFLKTVVKKEVPDDIPVLKIKKATVYLAELIVDAKLAPSKNEARRLIEQGAVKVDGAVIGDREAVIEGHSGMIVQVGKRKYVKIK